MAASDVAIGIIFLSQTVVGILGNFWLTYHHLLLCFSGNRIRFTDMILKHLIIANILILLCKGVPQTMAALGWKESLSTSACKLVFYLHRVGRGVSIGSTSLLSVFQAITISPRSSRLSELKVKAPKYAAFFIYLSWILCMLVNSIFPMFMTRKWNNTNITGHKDHGYCSSIRHDKIVDILNVSMLSFPDVFCLGLMLWASSFMVLVLHRHKQQVRHIHRANVSSRLYPESKATKTILLLVSTFVGFYTLSCIFQVYLGLIDYPSLLLVHTTAIFAGCFPAISPFLLMSCDSCVSSHFFACIRNRVP